MLGTVSGRLTGLAALLVLATSAAAAPVAKGKAAPVWKGKTTQGKTLSSAQFKGRVVLMNFFSYG